jgi:hypothetical protein
MQDRGEAGDKGGGGTNQDDECEGVHVELQIDCDRGAGGRKQPKERFCHPESARHADQGSHRGQQQRLGQQLPGEPEPACAERQPDAELLVPGDRARQQQVRHVCAHDQEYHETNRHEDAEGGPEETLPPGVRLPDRNYRGLQPFIYAGIHLRESLRQSFDFSPCLVERDTGPQTGNGPVGLRSLVKRAILGIGQLRSHNAMSASAGRSAAASRAGRSENRLHKSRSAHTAFE